MDQEILLKRFKKSNRKTRKLFFALKNHGSFDVSLLSFKYSLGKENLDHYYISLLSKGYKRCALFIDFNSDSNNVEYQLYVYKETLISSKDSLIDYIDEATSIKFINRFFAPYEDKNIPKGKVACRVRFGNNGSIYARPLEVHKSSIEEDIVKYLKEPKNKDYEMVLAKDLSQKYNFEVDKYMNYIDSNTSDYKVENMGFETRCQFYIDRHQDIDYVFKNEVYKNGYKFKKHSDLKKHLYLVVKSTLKDKYDDEVYKYCLEYFDKKYFSSYIEKKTRFMRKAFANYKLWNYFATFTYDEFLHSEDSFDKSLKTYFKNIHDREGVVILGGFERSGSGRLHFHAVMHIPDSYFDKLKVIDEEYYDKDAGRKRTSPISSYLKKKFGRCEFISINSEEGDFSRVLSYVCKYITKQQNAVYSSRGLKSELYGFIDDFNEHVVGYLDSKYHNAKFIKMDEETIFKEIK